MKTVLILSAGIEAIHGIKTAKSMGLHVVVSDGNPEAPGFAFADDSIIASTYDIPLTIKKSLEYNNNIRKIDGVLSIAADIPLTVSSVAKALNLRSISLTSARLASNKLEMKEKFLNDNVPIPWFSEVKSYSELKKIKEIKKFPLIIKPVDSRGARGVILLTEYIDLEWAFNKSKENSQIGSVMVEQYLNGPQISSESLIQKNKIYTPGLADRNYEFMEKFSPFVIENGGDLPSVFADTKLLEINNTLLKAAQSLGIKSGIVKGDLVLHNGKIFIIEIAPRLSGGYFCTHEIPMSTGVDLVKVAILESLGEEINEKLLIPNKNNYVSQRWIFPQKGIVKKIYVEEDFMKNPDIFFFDIRVKVGDSIHNIDSHPARSGLVMTKGNSRESASRLASETINKIKIFTE